MEPLAETWAVECGTLSQEPATCRFWLQRGINTALTAFGYSGVQIPHPAKATSLLALVQLGPLRTRRPLGNNIVRVISGVSGMCCLGGRAALARVP